MPILKNMALAFSCPQGIPAWGRQALHAEADLELLDPVFATLTPLIVSGHHLLWWFGPVGNNHGILYTLILLIEEHALTGSSDHDNPEGSINLPHSLDGFRSFSGIESIVHTNAWSRSAPRETGLRFMVCLVRSIVPNQRSLFDVIRWNSGYIAGLGCEKLYKRLKATTPIRCSPGTISLMQTILIRLLAGSRIF